MIPLITECINSVKISEIKPNQFIVCSLLSDDEEFKPTRPCGWGRGTETSQVSLN